MYALLDSPLLGFNAVCRHGSPFDRSRVDSMTWVADLKMYYLNYTTEVIYVIDRVGLKIPIPPTPSENFNDRVFTIGYDYYVSEKSKKLNLLDLNKKQQDKLTDTQQSLKTGLERLRDRDFVTAEPLFLCWDITEKDLVNHSNTVYIPDLNLIVTTREDLTADSHPYSIFNLSTQMGREVCGNPNTDFFKQITLVDNSGNGVPLYLNVNGNVYPVRPKSFIDLPNGIHVHISHAMESKHDLGERESPATVYENTAENRKLLNLFENYEDAKAYGDSEQVYLDSLKAQQREFDSAKAEHDKELLILKKQLEVAKAASEMRTAATKEKVEETKYVPALIVGAFVVIGGLFKLLS